MSDDLLTGREAAVLVGRPLGTVWSWAHTGKLPVAQWSGSHRLFRRCDVLALAERLDRQHQGKNRGRPDREPTAEEVERCIAEQLQCLPIWWAEDEEEQRRKAERDRREAA